MVAKTIEFFKGLPTKVGGFTSEELKRVDPWVKQRIKLECKYGVGTVDEQLDFCMLLEKLMKSDRVSGITSLRRHAVLRWALRTSNFCGRLYATGHEHGHTSASHHTIERERSKTKKKNKARTANATLEKKARGQVNKLKVQALYKENQYRRLTKAAASIRIARIVCLSPETVRKYLVNL